MVNLTSKGFGVTTKKVGACVLDRLPQLRPYSHHPPFSPSGSSKQVNKRIPFAFAVSLNLGGWTARRRRRPRFVSS